MQPIIAFLTEHWFLSLVFIGSFCWVVFLESRGGQKGFGLSPQQTTQLMNDKNVVLVDMRSKESFEQGHIIGSKHIALDQAKEDLNLFEKYKNKTIVLICAEGRSVQTMLNNLKKAGYENVKLLAGGIAAWRKEELPLVKK